jgi:hypothetical protein
MMIGLQSIEQVSNEMGGMLPLELSCTRINP